MSKGKKEHEFSGRLKIVAAEVGALIGLVALLMALVDEVPTKLRPFLIAIGVISTGALWWFLFHIARDKEPYSRHDLTKERYVHSKPRRIGAVSGLVIIPLAIGAVVAAMFGPDPKPKLEPCPPWVVAVARFKNDAGQQVREDLVELLELANVPPAAVLPGRVELERRSEGVIYREHVSAVSDSPSY